jgi:hypothetical protein
MTTVSYKTGVIEVLPNAYAFIQKNCATNAAFIVSDEGVLVIDSLMTALFFSRTESYYWSNDNS